MPARLAGQTAGHPSLSDDGSGNVVIADGKALIVSDLGAGLASIRSSVNTGTGLRFQEASNVVEMLRAGSIKAQVTGIGLEVPATSVLQLAANMVCDPAAAQSITAASQTVAPARALHLLSADAAYTMTAEPTIPAGTDGRLCLLLNSGTNDITLQDVSVLAGSTLWLDGGGNVTLGAGDMLALMWSDDKSAWIQWAARSNV